MCHCRCLVVVVCGCSCGRCCCCNCHRCQGAGGRKGGGRAGGYGGVAPFGRGATWICPGKRGTRSGRGGRLSTSCHVWQAAGAGVGGGHGIGRGCGPAVAAAGTRDVGRGKPAPATGGGMSPSLPTGGGMSAFAQVLAEVITAAQIWVLVLVEHLMRQALASQGHQLCRGATRHRWVCGQCVTCSGHMRGRLFARRGLR